MFLRNALVNALGNFVRQVALGAQEFGARAMLPPSVFGVWELASLIRRVGNILDPGFLSAAQRDLPVLRGAGNVKEESEYRSTTFFTHLASRGLLAGAVLLYVFVFGQRFSVFERAAVLAAPVMLIFFAIIESLATFYQTAERYHALSQATILSSVITAGGALAATLYWGIWGFIAANVAGLALYAALLARPLGAQGLPIKPVWRPDLFRRQAGFALPLKAADYPLGLLGEIDLLVVSRFAGLGPLAIYTTGKTLLNQAVQITSWLALVLIVRINNRSGSDAQRRRLGTEIERYLTVVDVVILPILICSIYVVGRPFIERFMPAYGESANLLPWMLLTMYFVPQTTIVRNLWILDKKIGPLARSNLVGLLAATLSIAGGALSYGFSLGAVARGYLLGHLVYYLWIMGSVGREALGDRGSLVVAMQALLSCGYTAIVLAALPDKPVFLAAHGTLPSLGINAGIAGLLLTPLVAYGVRKSKLISYTVSMCRSVVSAPAG